MSRNVVAIVSSILFVTLAGLLVLVPVPYVTWRPGSTTDVLSSTAEGPLLEVTGLENFDVSGQLHMTTVSKSRVNTTVSLPEAMIAYFSEDSDSMPRDVIYPPGKSTEQVREEAVAQMDTSRTNATVAALRAAGQQVTDMPMVSAVLLSGPANGKLHAGDLIESIDGRPVTTRDDVGAMVRERAVGDPVVFKVLRERQPHTVSVVTAANGDSQPVVGISVGVGHLYGPDVIYRIDSSIVGPSAGLIFGVAIYDKITEGSLLGDAVVAGTGELDAAGKVLPIGGIRAKVSGAEKAGASIFLLPQENCADLGDMTTDVRLVPVGTLKDAIAALQLIKEGQTTMEVAHCE